MSMLEEIKARAEAAIEARLEYNNAGDDDYEDLTIRLAFVAELSSYDVPPLIAALEAALATADALIEENQDATTLQSWGLMTAAQKVRDAIKEALQ